MRNFPHTLSQALFTITLLLCAAATAQAQDPVKVDPEHYKVLQQTANVRILEYRDTPGHKVPKHSHPNYFVVVVSDATRLFTDCVNPGTPVNLTAGEVLQRPATTHCEENVGTTDTHLLVVELTGTPKKATRQSGRKRR